MSTIYFFLEAKIDLTFQGEREILVHVCTNNFSENDPSRLRVFQPTLQAIHNLSEFKTADRNPQIKPLEFYFFVQC